MKNPLNLEKNRKAKSGKKTSTKCPLEAINQKSAQDDQGVLGSLLYG